jgi:hypothetical protein
MEEFGKAKEEWLKTFPRLPGGIPSHDTFIRSNGYIFFDTLSFWQACKFNTCVT